MGCNRESQVPNAVIGVPPAVSEAAARLGRGHVGSPHPPYSARHLNFRDGVSSSPSSPGAPSPRCEFPGQTQRGHWGRWICVVIVLPGARVLPPVQSQEACLRCGEGIFCNCLSFVGVHVRKASALFVQSQEAFLRCGQGFFQLLEFQWYGCHSQKP